MINKNLIFNKPACLLSILIILMLPKLSAASIQGHLDQKESPQQMVQRVIDNTFIRIKKERASNDTQAKNMQLIVLQELMPQVDHIYSALYVLGSHAAKTEKRLLSDYFDVFQIYLVKSYAVVLKSYREQEVVVVPSNSAEDKNTMSIKALLKEKGKPDIELVFKVRKSNSGQWKAYDIVVEGISLLQSKRAEFADILRKEGVAGLTAALKSNVQ